MIIDGKEVAAQLREEFQEQVESFSKERGYVPGLATVLVGDDAASATYVRSKHRASKKVGIQSFEHQLPGDVAQADLIELVTRLGNDLEVSGILVQLPLPEGLDEHAVIQAIPPSKDVDGLHPMSQANLFQGKPGLRPCTPLGIMRLLESSGTELTGARAVVVGRSLLVGKPIALMLLEAQATVTICHSRTKDLAREVGSADVLIAAIGRPEFIPGGWIREGSTVIDVGINRIADGSLVGDVEFDGAKDRAAAITPVPGGVGPMTVAMLMQNTLNAARIQADL